ncbi:hypothetical protein [Diplocloster hominis]|uniref:hypothetical protein n=1 Tax=Diplocloster hominis TaxID=3079010 RepID=UPI0031BB8406
MSRIRWCKRGFCLLLVLMIGLTGCQTEGTGETDETDSGKSVGAADSNEAGDMGLAPTPATSGADGGEVSGEPPAGDSSGRSEAGPSAAPEAVMKGTVIQVSDSTILLAVNENASSDLFTVGTADIPIVDSSGNPVKAGEVVPGMLVDVEYDGFIEEIYPGIVANPSLVRITDAGDDMTGFYLTIVRDIFETDSALNSDIHTIALDLTKVHNLSDAEKAALAYLVWTQLGYEAFQSTWDELSEQGYIDKDRLSFEDGILITLTDTPVKGSSFDFTVKKWRGGDGSIGYDDCKAKKSGTEWEYKLDGAWIS